DDRNPLPGRILQRSFGLLVEPPRDDVDERGGTVDRSLLADGGGDAAADEVPPECGRELGRSRDDERSVTLRLGPQLLDDAEDRARLDRELRLCHQMHYRRKSRPRPRPRTWIAWRTPIAIRLATIDEPPTLTIGSGIPVTG